MELSKKIYIDCAYDMMREKGFNGVSIRGIANELGVSSTSLYRHFDNLEHLKLYASLRYLKDYLQEVQEIGFSEFFSIDMYFAYWRLFVKHAFNEPEIYDQVFFKKHEYSLGNLFKEYYSMFAEEIFDTDHYLNMWMTDYDINRRSYITLRNALRNSDVSDVNIKEIAEIHVLLFKGMLKEYFDGMPFDEKREDEFIEKCKKVLEFIINKKTRGTMVDTGDVNECEHQLSK